MAGYHEDLLNAARKLIERDAGQKGPLPGVRVRRSISTSYYALFHFLLDEVGRATVGTSPGLRWRRRVLARSMSHKGMLVALNKVKGNVIDVSVAAMFKPGKAQSPPVITPGFARLMADAFADAQAKRTLADYDLDAELSGADARLVASRVERAIAAWESATSPKDRTFKKGLAFLMLMSGRVRKDD